MDKSGAETRIHNVEFGFEIDFVSSRQLALALSLRPPAVTLSHSISEMFCATRSLKRRPFGIPKLFPVNLPDGQQCSCMSSAVFIGLYDDFSSR